MLSILVHGEGSRLHGEGLDSVFNEFAQAFDAKLGHVFPALRPGGDRKLHSYVIRCFEQSILLAVDLALS